MKKSKYLKARDFFADLCWNDNIETLHTNVFTQEELDTSPLKWLKYVLLARVGLSSITELNKTIKRFEKDDISAIRYECEKLFSNDSENELMAVIKLVSIDKAGQLPNHRIYSRRDIDNTVEFIKENLRVAQEIWICTSTVGEGNSNFGGRITFPMDGKFAPNLLEMVWFTSPRKIQDFTLEYFEYPFVSACKFPGTITYCPKIFHIPAKFNSSILKTMMASDMQSLLQIVDNFKDNVESLKMILHSAGAKELSLEFKSSFGKISFIDWDTEIETSIE